MNIQSISIVVPTKKCVNNCKFCVSRMHDNPFENHFDEFQIKKRIRFAINNNVNTCIITGTGEPLQNREFLNKLWGLFKKMDHPFPNVEFQTSGVMLMDHRTVNDVFTKEETQIYDNISLLKYLGVNTISLSISDLFNSDNNLEIMGVPKILRFNLKDLCKFIKDNGFNLRLSLNMSKVYNGEEPERILTYCKSLGADQITFRKLYYSDDNSPQTRWVKENNINPFFFSKIYNYIEKKGTPCYKLPFGPIAYSIMKMTVVVDNDCMNKDNIENLKYVILRENGKLYCQWDDEGSLIF